MQVIPMAEATTSAALTGTLVASAAFSGTLTASAPFAATLIASAAFAATLITAAISDIRGFYIANAAPVMLVAAFVPAAWGVGMGGEALLLHVGAALLVFSATAGLFAFGLWGGGDAKLVPAVALWIGFPELPRFLLVMALAGGVLGVVGLVARRVPLGAFGERLTTSGHVPYGVAIAAAGLDWWAGALLPFVTG